MLFLLLSLDKKNLLHNNSMLEYLSSSIRRSICRSICCHFSSNAAQATASAIKVSSEAIEKSRNNTSSLLKSNLKPSLEEPALIKLKKERDPEKLFALFKENAHNRLVIENKYAFEDTVSRLAGSGNHDYIEHLLEHQKSLPQGRREGFVVRIIMLYGRASMTKHALDTFYNMHLFGCRRTVKSFNAALKVLAQARDLSATDLFLREVPGKFGIELDIVSLNIVINAFCNMDILDKAYLVMINMKKAGIKPDVATYTTLISAFYKHGRWQIANGLWNLMLYRGCRPNIATFNARIQFLVNRGRAWDANNMKRLMENLGIQPDEVTYNLVIKGFCRAGYIDMAKRVYSAFLGRGFKPNVKIYQTMVHYLCEERDYELAYTFCKDCMEKNQFVKGDTISQLLDGLRKNGKVDKARMILALTQKRDPPFSSEHLHAFRSILARS